MDNENLLILVLLFSLTSGFPLIKPVNNAYASLNIADLFRITKVDNNFTIFDYDSSKEKDVFMDCNEKIIKDLLFCPRTFDNPLMGYFGRNFKREHVMCKEVPYQNIFTCITTNLRAECKSLKSFENFETKIAMFQTENFKKMDTSTASFHIIAMDEVKNETDISSFFTEERIIYALILVIIGLGICLGAVFFKYIRRRCPCHDPAASNLYFKTPVDVDPVDADPWK